MKKIILFFAVVIFVQLFSCMTEKGSYNYNDINEILIDTINGRNVSQFDSLRIKPTITQKFYDNEQNLEYLWYIRNSKDIYSKIDTISKERDLNYYVGVEPGDYKLIYKVTDKIDGRFARKELDMWVQGGNKGLLILSSINNKANVAIVNPAGKVFQDIYYAASGEYAGENPVAIASINVYQKPGMQDILVLCNDERGGVMMNPYSFGREKNYQNVFYTKPAKIKPECYVSSQKETIAIDYDFIINNGKLHNRDFYNVQTINYELLFRSEILGDYYLSPYTFVNTSTLMFYDNKNYRFVVLGCGGGQIQKNSFSPAPIEPTMDINKQPFNPNDVKLELVYGAEGWRQSGLVGHGYGIFRQPGTTARSSMYRLKFSIGDKTSFNPPYGTYFTPYFKETIDGATDLERATTYAMSKKDPYMYYAVDNKIYSYDLEYDIAKVIYVADSVVGAGAKIDYLYFQEGYNVDLTLRLHVAVSQSGKGDKSGTIDILNLARNGDVQQRDTTYHNICGKVVNMCYKIK